MSRHTYLQRARRQIQLELHGAQGVKKLTRRMKDINVAHMIPKRQFGTPVNSVFQRFSELSG